MRSPLEKDIQLAFVTMLRRAGFYVIRHNNVKIGQNKGGSVFIKLSDIEKGHPDIIALYGGITYYIEVKAGKSAQSEWQKDRENEIKRNGGIYLIIRSVMDGINFINSVTKTGYCQ